MSASFASNLSDLKSNISSKTMDPILKKTKDDVSEISKSKETPSQQETEKDSNNLNQTKSVKTKSFIFPKGKKLISSVSQQSSTLNATNLINEVSASCIKNSINISDSKNSSASKTKKKSQNAPTPHHSKAKPKPLFKDDEVDDKEVLSSFASNNNESNKHQHNKSLIISEEKIRGSFMSNNQISRLNVKEKTAPATTKGKKVKKVDEKVEVDNKSCYKNNSNINLKQSQNILNNSNLQTSSSNNIILNQVNQLNNLNLHNKSNSTSSKVKNTNLQTHTQAAEDLKLKYNAKPNIQVKPLFTEEVENSNLSLQNSSLKNSMINQGNSINNNHLLNKPQFVNLIKENSNELSIYTKNSSKNIYNEVKTFKEKELEVSFQKFLFILLIH